MARGSPPLRTAWIASGPARLSSNRTANFDLGSSVEPTLFLCQLDHGPQMPCFTAPSINGVNDGDHTLTVWSLDLAMNRSAPVRYSWTVDATAPKLVLLGGPQADLDHVLAGGLVQDRHERTRLPVLLARWQGVRAVQVTVNYAGLAVGEHTFEVYGTDRAGNKSVQISRSWTVS